MDYQLPFILRRMDIEAIKIIMQPFAIQCWEPDRKLEIEARVNNFCLTALKP